MVWKPQVCPCNREVSRRLSSFYTKAKLSLLEELKSHRSQVAIQGSCGSVARRKGLPGPGLERPHTLLMHRLATPVMDPDVYWDIMAVYGTLGLLSSDRD